MIILKTVKEFSDEKSSEHLIVYNGIINGFSVADLINDYIDTEVTPIYLEEINRLKAELEKLQ